MKAFPYIAVIVCCLFINLSTTNAQQLNEQELKINVQHIDNPTEQIAQLVPITFEYDTQKFNSIGLPPGHQYGFLASNVKHVLPHVAKESSKVYTTGKNATRVAKYQDVDSERLIPLLVAAIKEQQQQIEALRNEVATLKSSLE